jgi:CheY-like chemotaxis protein
MTYNDILLIDDDADDQEIFHAALDLVSTDVNCTAISDARVALKQLLDETLKPGMIFLDLNMPVMNGEQFLAEMKKEESLMHIPVVILSTSAHPQAIEHTKALGAADYITKPNNFDDLVRILKVLIN